ncbi:hypothetical protein ABID70_000537 [Clavibacter michiganensis]|uniref:hypothetical protein n=1 Tax=Clavibacter michiganensis TaxID=28447 RepID=UPI001D796BE2|nr:hypothetical protein [Clavibacter michiganensis]MBP2457971.1 hypothetical protein [Clavibacter michiganensis]MDQ0410541.1 hypothetical protein [Clavibacter michiganensis]
MSLLLVGCAAAPTAGPAPAPAPAPSLTQEQQDASTFRSLYETYISMPFDEETEEDLRRVLTGSALSSDLESLQSDRQSGQRIIGHDTFRDFSVTDHGVDPSSGAYMVAEACLDVSGTRVLDAQGADITPQRENLLSLQMKAMKIEGDGWRISDFVRNDGVHACD